MSGICQHMCELNSDPDPGVAFAHFYRNNKKAFCVPQACVTVSLCAWSAKITGKVKKDRKCC